MGHQVTVVSSSPLGDIIRNREATGRVAKWAVELSPYGIKYEPRTAIKSQVLPDFVADWTEMQQPAPVYEMGRWSLYFDGSKMYEGSGAGVVLISPSGDKMCYVLQIHFTCTNNVAEYEALLHGLRVAKEMGVSRIMCYGDSDLVVQQTMGTWDANDPNMAAYRRLIDQVGGHFAGLEMEHIDRRKNMAADELSRFGSKRTDPIPPGIFLDHIYCPSIKPPKESELGIPLTPDAIAVAVISESPDWREPFIRFLTTKELPDDERSARQIVRRSKAYTIINNELYKRSPSGVFLRCIEPQEGQRILADIHGGDCRHHAGARSLVAKALRHSFFWTTAHHDANDIVRKCVGCQMYARQEHLPATALKTIPLTWPFAVWGLDMVGPFKKARGGLTHLLIAVDKFTKWVEAKPIKKLHGAI